MVIYKQGWNSTAANIHKDPVLCTGYSAANHTSCKAVLHRVIASGMQMKVTPSNPSYSWIASVEDISVEKEVQTRHRSNPIPEFSHCFSALGHRSFQGYHRWLSVASFNKQQNNLEPIPSWAHALKDRALSQWYSGIKMNLVLFFFKLVFDFKQTAAAGKN